MPQWLYILRGCVVAYLVGVLIFTVVATIDGPANAGESFGLALIFGGLLAIPFAILALIIWAVLASLRKRVTLLHASAICAGLLLCGATVLGYADGGLPGLLIAAVVAPLIGGIFGAVFWVGAFGLHREVQFGHAKDMP